MYNAISNLIIGNIYIKSYYIELKTGKKKKKII